MFGGRVAPLVAHFSEQRKLSRKDIADLRKLLEELDDDGPLTCSRSCARPPSPAARRSCWYSRCAGHCATHSARASPMPPGRWCRWRCIAVLLPAAQSPVVAAPVIAMPLTNGLLVGSIEAAQAMPRPGDMGGHRRLPVAHWPARSWMLAQQRRFMRRPGIADGTWRRACSSRRRPTACLR
jgi:hypothetical protein